MTVTARRMRRGARTITTGKQLRGQLTGPGTHVGPNALLRSSSYPAPTASPGTGPLRNPAIPSGGWFNLNGSNEFNPTADDAHNGMACDNWASGPTTAYAYNNNPANHGGIVPGGGLVIDGFPVAAGALVFQFMDLSAGGPNLQNGVATGGVVFRGCRFRGYQDPSSSGFITVESDCTVPLYIMYGDFGGVGIDVTDQYSSNSLNSLATKALVAYRNYFSLHGTAIQPNGWAGGSGEGCDVIENFMEKWVYNPAGGGDHDNGVSASGGGWTCFRWLRNYIVIEATDANGLDLTQTDCMSIGSDGGASNLGTGTNADGTGGFQIRNNYCAGGSDSYYLGYNGTNTVSGLNFASNLLSTSSWPDGGNSGAVSFVPPWTGTTPLNTKSGNLWADGPDAGTTFI